MSQSQPAPRRTETGDVEKQMEGMRCCEYATGGSLLPIAATEGETHIVRYANPAFCRFAGKEKSEVIGHPFEAIVSEAEKYGSVSLLDQVYRSGKAETITSSAHSVAKDKTGYWSYAAWPLLDSKRQATGVMILVTDVTEAALIRRQSDAANNEIREINEQLLIAGIREHELSDRVDAAKEQLFQAQKMEGIGRLAGGIAHDFNNLLTAIIGFTELAKESIPPQDAAQDYLSNISKASGRAATLTAQLLTFARKQIIQPQVVDINAVILDIGKMLERIIGENIELVLLPMPEVKQVRIDPGQFGQVLVNLVVNARDAMPDGGKVTIQTSNFTVDQQYADQNGELTPGTYALLTVTDTGTGISKEARPHVFEPFFTTKIPGKGTGMGLATCYGIVKQSGGCIQIANLPAAGTTVQIFLPQADEPVIQRQMETVSPLLQGTETIVLVEDEPMVREVGSSLLRQWGYTVIEASNGLEALRLLQDYPGKIDLMLTDMVMPQMSGTELAARVRVSHPHIKILHTSGYTGNTLGDQVHLDPDFMFLQKPFTSADLAKKVRETLGKRAH